MCKDSKRDPKIVEPEYSIQQYRIDVERIQNIRAWGCTHRCACLQVFNGKDCTCKNV